MKTIECPFCTAKFSKKAYLKMHIIKTEIKKKGIDQLTGEMKYIETVSNITPNQIKEIFKRYSDGESSWTLSKEYGITNHLLRTLLKAKGIHLRDVKECKNKYYQINQKKTIMAKYGVDNISKLEAIKEKKKSTFLSRYGVQTNLLLKAVKEKKNERLREYYNSPELVKKTTIKAMNTFLNKYGVENPAQITRVRKIISKKAKERMLNKSIDERRKITLNARMVWNLQNEWESAIERRVQNILDDNHLSYEKRVFLYGYNYDIILSRYKIIIEINGDFWHANPSLYHANDIIYDGKTTAKDIWKKDKRKKLIAISKGWKYLILWESEINGMSDRQLIDIINTKIGENKCEL